MSLRSVCRYAGRRRPLVPIEPQPGEGVEDPLERLLGGALGVGVLDPEDEDATVSPREGPVEQRGAGSAHVEVTCRTGREADTNRLRHGVHCTRLGTARSGTLDSQPSQNESRQRADHPHDPAPDTRRVGHRVPASMARSAAAATASGSAAKGARAGRPSSRCARSPAARRRLERRGRRRPARAHRGRRRAPALRRRRDSWRVARDRRPPS